MGNYIIHKWSVTVKPKGPQLVERVGAEVRPLPDRTTQRGPGFDL
jgi:hypothetical protein